MHPLIKHTAIVTSLALSCSAALAAEALKAKVVSTNDGKLVIETPEKAPEWLRKGAAVQALGWQTKVLSVDGGKVVLELDGARASRVKANSDIVVREVTNKDHFGC